ncbi:hypothetical protein BDQ12DRAFT_694271 [Crucibulum laeve]|uniref:Uncharacterized protein n=1 Tax=Crucibulum laeve TaxID=68775 RepID=A0A5C3LRK2_9AGAR|nr:hypothetical protein BDQ12DRAFT_694271 [Crucibulum laeve]
MANIQNTTAQNAPAQNATAQTDPPQIVNNTMLHAVLSRAIKILKPLKKITTRLAPDHVLVIMVDDNMVYTSKNLDAMAISVLEVNWDICFKASSTIKIESKN